MKFKVGDVLTCVEAYGLSSKFIDSVVIVREVGEKKVYPIVVEVLHGKELTDEVGLVLSKDGWFYSHKTEHNFRFDIVEEFEGNV